jgi:FkbM family methyltransferase
MPRHCRAEPHHIGMPTSATIRKLASAVVRTHLIGEVLIRSHLIRCFNWSFRMRSSRIRVPILGALGGQNLRELRNGRENHLDAIIEATFARLPGSFLDVGVNLGQTLVKVKTIDRDRRYIGFEPNPSCCHYASRLIELNRFTDCTLVPVGLHESAGVLPLHLRFGDDDPTATMAFEPGLLDVATTRCVAVSRGDDVLAALDVEAIALLKIDVEGVELEVLRGLSGTIERLQPVIVCEILPERDADGNVVATVSKPTLLKRAQAMSTLLAEAGYAIGRLDDAGRVTAVPDIEQHLEVGPGDTFDFVFMPPGADWLLQVGR